MRPWPIARSLFDCSVNVSFFGYFLYLCIGMAKYI